MSAARFRAPSLSPHLCVFGRVAVTSASRKLPHRVLIVRLDHESNWNLNDFWREPGRSRKSKSHHENRLISCGATRRSHASLGRPPRWSRQTNPPSFIHDVSHPLDRRLVAAATKPNHCYNLGPLCRRRLNPRVHKVPFPRPRQPHTHKNTDIGPTYRYRQSHECGPALLRRDIHTCTQKKRPTSHSNPHPYTHQHKTDTTRGKTGQARREFNYSQTEGTQWQLI